MDISRIAQISKLFRKKKGLDLRPQTVYLLQKFRDVYLTAAARYHIDIPPSLEKLIYKAISSQKYITTLDLREADITDEHVLALMETLIEFPLVSTLDLRDNHITEKGVRGILELMRHRLSIAKGQSPAEEVPDHMRLLTSVQLKGNDVSDSQLQHLRQYSSILLVEDKRLEIQAVLNQIDYNEAGGIDEGELRVALKLCGGDDPTKRDLQYFMDQLSSMTWQVHGGGDTVSGARACLEQLLLAKYAKSPSKKEMADMLPWDTLVQIRHTELKSPVTQPAEKADDDQRPATIVVDDNVNASPDQSPTRSTAFELPSPSGSPIHGQQDSPLANAIDCELSPIHGSEWVEASDSIEDQEGCPTTLDDGFDSLHDCVVEEEETTNEEEITDDNPQPDISTPEEAPIVSEFVDTVEVVPEPPSPTKSDFFPLDEPSSVDQVEIELVSDEPAQSTDDDQMVHTMEDVPELCLSDEVTLQSQRGCVAKLQHCQIRQGVPLNSLYESIYFENVVALILSHNQLESVAFLQTMEPMRSLRVLDLSHNTLSKLTAVDMIGIRNVEVLDLSHNQFKSICGIEHLTKLRALSYEGNGIRCAKNLECLERLEILNLSHNMIMVPQSLRLLSMNKLLTHLNIDENPIVNQGQHRKNSAHILNIIPTLRSLGCIHLAALIIKEKHKKPNKTDERLSIFEFLDPPRPWVDYACEMLSLVCDSFDEGTPPSPVPKVSRTQQKSKDEQRNKALPHHIARKSAPPSMPPPPPQSNTTKTTTISRSSQQKKAIQLSTPKASQVVKKEISNSVLCHPPRALKPTPSSEFKVTVAIVPPSKGFLQPTKASIYAHAEQRRQRDAVKKKKKPANALYKRLKRREEKLRQVVSTVSVSPSKVPCTEVVTSSIEIQPQVVAMQLASWVPPSVDVLKSSPVKPGPLPITSTDTFLAQIRLNEFVTLVTEDHSTATTALDILISMAERPVLDLTKFKAYKTNLESLNILADLEIDSNTKEILEEASRQSIKPLSVLQVLKELNQLKTTIKDLIEQIDTGRNDSAGLQESCVTIRNSSFKHLLSPPINEAPLTPSFQGPPPVIHVEREDSNASSLDLLSPVHQKSTDLDDEDIFGVNGTSDEISFQDVSCAETLDQNEWAANSLNEQENDENFIAEVEMSLGEPDDIDLVAPPVELEDQDVCLDMDESDQMQAVGSVEFGDEASHFVSDGPDESHGEDEYIATEQALIISDEIQVEKDEEDADLEVDTDNAEYEVEYSAENELDNDLDTPVEVENDETEDVGEEEALTYGDWEQRFDPSTKHYYWFNSVTDESSWTPPDGWPYSTPGQDDEEVEADEEVEHEETQDDQVMEPTVEDHIAMALVDGNPPLSADDDDFDFDFDDSSLPDL